MQRPGETVFSGEFHSCRHANVAKVFSSSIYFVFERLFPQVRRIALATSAFPITNIAASVVYIQF